MGFPLWLFDHAGRHLGDFGGYDLHVIGQIPTVDRYAVVYARVPKTLGNAGGGIVAVLRRCQKNITGGICRQRVRYRSSVWDLRLNSHG